MIDQNSQFQAILTAIGEAKQANADALGIPWTFAQMGVGDANGTDPFPDRLQTKLINEWHRAPLNQLKPDPKNAGIIIGAWGNTGAHLNRSSDVRKMFKELHCLKLNKTGEPAHPLYQPNTATPIPVGI